MKKVKIAKRKRTTKKVRRIGPSEVEVRAARDATLPYLGQINDTPALLSLLYDIDLLPEQIRLFVNARRMAAFCEIFKLVPVEVMQKAMTENVP